MRVEQLWRYPIKSMAGERLAETAVGERGVIGDRAWVIRDEESGAICGAKSLGALMRLSSAYTEPPLAEGSSAVSVRFEDGSSAGSSDADIHARLSAALERKVTLWPLVPASEKEHYKRAVPIGNMTEAQIRAFFGRNQDEPLPDMSPFPVELMEYESPLGTYFDAFPLLVMTTKSLKTMQERAPGSRFDVRRFRPNILVGGVDNGHPFPELEWAGRRAAIGDVILKLTLRCPRCVMVTRPFQDLDKDPNVMRALVRETNGDFGIGAEVEQSGTVREGDAFALLD